jgi:hypothetical protein
MCKEGQLFSIACVKEIHMITTDKWTYKDSRDTLYIDFIHIANMGVEYFLKHDDIKFWTWILLTIRQTMNWILPYSII